jgi:PAS domain S-box-containing protein
MNQLAAKKSAISPSTLSVSYKSPPFQAGRADCSPEALIITDARFIITGLNDTAEAMYGFTAPEIAGKCLFDLFDFDLVGTTIAEATRLLINKGFWQGDLIYYYKKRQLVYSTTCNIIRDGNANPTQILISTRTISDRLRWEKELTVAEHKYRALLGAHSEAELFRSFMRNSPTLGWIYDEDGTLVYGNPRFLEISGFSGEISKNTGTEFANAQEVMRKILERNRAVLRDSHPIITEDEFDDNQGNLRHYLSYCFLLPSAEDKRLIGGHAVEITDSKKSRREIDKMYERYTFAINASSDAIWDMDLSTKTIFRSDTFSAFSGYPKEAIQPTLEWFLDKIHPSDKNRVSANIQENLQQNVTHWENEYRFRIADGSYRHLLDKAFAIYEDGILSRVIGSMQDMTDRKKLEAQLLNEQVQKQKVVNQAIIQAQEKERNRISGELHDNVNQLLMSAKLHICVAKTRAEGETELLDKANQYLIMAVEEIRGLSKKLNTTVITNIGLLKSIADIGSTMMLLKNIQLHTYISEEVVAKMSTDQQMMVYRILQEQSNNILKYAETNEALISLKQVNGNFELIISDNGQGFDKNEEKANGIGFINIFNRVDAYNGKAEIIASPGNGCTLIITFPTTENKLLN